MDKLDRVGVEGVRALLGKGRKDESGDFTKGAELADDQIARIISFISPETAANDLDTQFGIIAKAVEGSKSGAEGVANVTEIMKLVTASGYEHSRVHVDTGIVRGLDYYTGAVFEAQLTFPVQNEQGQTVVFGSVGGGGRYDDLVARFTGQQVPAVGFSIGVSRLLTALQMRKATVARTEPLVVVTVFDKKEPAPSFALVRELRAAGIRAEAYVGTGKMGDQFKYADRRGAAVAIVEGPDERAAGELQIKDLVLGAQLANTDESLTASHAEFVGERKGQRTVKRSHMVDEVRAILARKG
jgi:histidyl-tRNA synthetase